MARIFILIIKILLFIFNLLLWLLAAAILAGVGYYFATLSQYDSLVNNTDNIVYRAVPLAILVLVALLLLLVSLVGFLGTCCDLKVLLVIYNIMMVIVIILQVTGGALSVIFSNQVIPEITRTLSGYAAQYNTTDDNIKSIIDEIQNGLQCCGSDGAADYKDNIIPRSCCIDATDTTTCPTFYLAADASLYRSGCISKIGTAISNSSTIAICVAIFLALFQCSGVVLSYILIFCNRKEDDPKVLSLKSQLPKY